MRRFISVTIVLVLLMSLTVTCVAASDAATLSHGVVMIEVGQTYSEGRWSEAEWEPICRGSGFFVGKENENPQFLITNRHVIQDYLDADQGDVFAVGEQYVRTHIRVYYSANDYEEAYVVDYGNAADQDFAILRLDEPTDKRAALPIEIPTDDMRGQTVLSVGFPGVAENDLFKSTTKAGEKDVVFDKGAFNKVSIETGTGVQMIMHSARIHPGNSGGPLVLEENGTVIGINTWHYSEGETEPIYYAVGMKSLELALKKNNISSSLDEKAGQAQTTAEPTGEPTATPTREPVKPEAPSGQNKHWYIYAILGAAIVGVIVLLAVLLRPVPPHTLKLKTTGVQPQTPKPGRVLIGVAGPLKDKRFELNPGGRLLIGRSSSCNVRFKDGTPGVSSTHCEIRFDGKTATIMDLKSSYGTFVDHKKLSPNVPTTLHRSLSIDIGSEKNRFVLQ